MDCCCPARMLRWYWERGGTRWCSWLRHCATGRKVAGSIPCGVIGTFCLHYGPGVDRSSNRNEYQKYFLGKGGRCIRLTTLSPSCADCLEILEPQPRGNRRTCPAVALPHNAGKTTVVFVVILVYSVHNDVTCLIVTSLFTSVGR
jgi:hypothetical protein